MPLFFIVLTCFFLSGATALIYEVIWVRLLALTFGNTVYAIGIVLTSFMSGLSLGSLLFGRWADRGNNLLKGYGVLEFGIALSVLMSPFLLETVSEAYLSLSITTMPLWLLSIIRYFLSFAVLLIPTTLMGGTLPVLSRYFIHSEAELEKRLGVLYALNTIGGVFGTILVGFILIRLLGLNAALKTTAVLNVCIGVVSYYLGMKEPSIVTAASKPETGGFQRNPGYGFALVAFFLSGFAAMVYEIAWNRLLVGVIGSTTYSFSIILIGYLSGIGLGSLVVSLISDKKRLGLTHFSIIEVLIGITCFCTLFIFPLLPPMMLKGMQIAGDSYYSVLLMQMLIVFFFIIVPTSLFGATFPIIAAVYSGGSDNRGRNIGNIYAANTFGAILGSSVAAFFFLPAFGGSLSVKIAAVLNILVGMAGFYVLGRNRILVFSAALMIIPLIPVNIADESLVSGVSVYGNRDDFQRGPGEQKFLYLKEGLNATIAVTTNSDGSITLSTNGKADGSTGEDMSTQIALAYFPLLLHERPEHVLVIGYGTGVTVTAAVDFPGVQKVDTVEIEPAVLDAAGFFEKAGVAAARHPRAEVFLDDARSHLLASKDTFDVIISEPSNPWINGIGNLFSKNFYQVALSKLNRGGMYCQWVQLYGLRSEDLRMIIRTFSSVFPDTTIWHSNPADIMLIGSGRGFSEFDYRALAAKLEGDRAGNLRAYLHIYDPVDFLSYYMTGPEGAAALSGSAALNTDDLPLLEFNAPFSLYSSTVSQNNRLLQVNLGIPRVQGYVSGRDFAKDFFFRKILNYKKLYIPVDGSWVTKLTPEMVNYIMLRDLALSFGYPQRTPSLHKALNYSSMDFAPDYEDTDLLLTAAEDLLREGNFERAQKLLHRIEKAPEHIIKHSQFYSRAGALLLKAGRFEEAMGFLKKANDINPYNFRSSIELADLYIHVQRLDMACAYYKKARTLLNNQMQYKVTDKIKRYCAD